MLFLLPSCWAGCWHSTPSAAAATTSADAMPYARRPAHTKHTVEQQRLVEDADRPIYSLAVWQGEGELVVAVHVAATAVHHRAKKNNSNCMPSIKKQQQQQQARHNDEDDENVDDGDEEQQQQSMYTSLVCSEEDSDVLSSEDLAEESSSSGASSDDDLQFPAADETTKSLPPAKYVALQKKLQIHDQKLGRSMHEGDDEGRPPASKRSRTAEAAAAAAAGEDDDEEGEEAAPQPPRGRGNRRQARGGRGRRRRRPSGTEEEEDQVDNNNNSSSSDNGADDGGSGSCRPPQQDPAATAAAAAVRPAQAADCGDDGGGGGNSSSSCGSNCRPKKCWLCTFANCKMAKQVSVFVATHAGTMDPAIMAEQIKKEVLREYPRARGIGRRHVLCHIREHVLIPGVRLASIVRSLITLAETLRCSLQQVDEDSGDLVVDIRNTELYLKVVTQITNVYKLDSSKLLFQNGVAPPLALGGGSGGGVSAAPAQKASASGAGQTKQQQQKI